MKSVKVGMGHTAEFYKEMSELCVKYEKLFVTNMRQLPQTNLKTHQIKLKPDAKPARQMLRRIKPEHMQAVKKELQELLAANCIFPVQFSDWVSPLVIVIKKNGKVRVCIDYRKLNKATQKDNFPIPFIDEILDEVAGHEMYSFCDGYRGYHQVAMDLADALKTTFVTPWGTFAYRVMPFGLSTAPATFQAVMTEALQAVIGKCLRVSFDDFAVYSSATKHVQELDTVFACLAKARLSLNPEKCYFAVTRGRMLGHVVDKCGIRVEPDKIRKMMDQFRWIITRPRSFCSAASYYRRAVAGFSEIICPLFQLLKKDANFEWKQEHQKAFEAMKEALCRCVPIRNPDWNSVFLVSIRKTEFQAWSMRRFCAAVRDMRHLSLQKPQVPPDLSELLTAFAPVFQEVSGFTSQADSGPCYRPGAKS